MVVIKDFEMPESCLYCSKRKCLHIDGKAYQMCGLNEDGYLRESWFNSENIPIDHRSEHCPLREVEAIPKDQYETRLKADMEAMFVELQLEIKELDSRAGYSGGGMPTFSTDYIRKKKVNELIQQKINALKSEQEET